MDDFAKSAFLWAERVLEKEEELGICSALVSALDPPYLTGTLLCTEDIAEIFPPFVELHDGYSWKYPGDKPPYRDKQSIHSYWFFPREFLAPRKQLIHCLLSHSPL